MLPRVPDLLLLAAAGDGLDIPAIIEKVGDVVYGLLAVLAIWGIYNTIVLYRTLQRKRLLPAQASQLIAQVRELCTGPRGPNIDAAVSVCQNPPYWHSALAQLTAVALRGRDQGLAKIKQTLVMEFHTEIVSAMETRLSSMSTIVRMGPLLGLLGTVASMIAAFGRIGGAEKVNPSALASDISLALWATAGGLLIATTIMLFANDIHARLRRLRDRTERQLQDVLQILEDLETASGRGRNAPATGRPVLPTR
jgi:biopolymer transport protein ExbB